MSDVKNLPDPLALWRAGMEFAQLGMEANAIITMRMMGFMGFWRMRDTEALRMITEKPPAFFEGWMRGMSAAMSGESAEKVATEAIKPLRKTTRANHLRLVRSGPSLGLIARPGSKS